ncbi:MAG: adenylate/guanylate cyclase domain-containing protein [Oligoflexus sp.]
MKKPSSKPLHKLNLYILSGSLFLLSMLLFFSRFQEYLTVKARKPIEFAVRAKLQREPVLDPRIKVYAFDEQTLSYLGYHDFSLDVWYLLIAHFAQYQPRSIFIDKIFQVPLGEKLYAPLSEEQTNQFIQDLKALPSPVVVGGFISQSQIPGRQTMNLFHRDYSLQNALAPDMQTKFNHMSWPPIEQGYFYGPHHLIRDAFQVGHITNIEFGYAKPFFRIDPNSLIPHAALLTSASIQIRNEKLYLQDQPVPLDRKNRIALNFTNREAYYARTKSLRHTIERINRGLETPDINPDDIVVILPAMYTGNTDFKDTPIGRLQGGYFGVTLINSALQNNWITESDLADSLLFLTAAAIMLVAAFMTKPILFFIFFFSLLIVLPAFGIFMFVMFSCSLSWLFATGSALVCSLIVFVERLRLESRAAQTQAATLRGALSPEIAESITRNPDLLQDDPVEQIVTVMFIDIVGFSLTTERQTPNEAFRYLKEQLGYIVDKIHNHGGLVDKSLGDGILCFFGYHLQESQAHVGHADQALLCAIDIQQEALWRAQTSTAHQGPIYPLRIGINTAAVYIGNLGTEGRIDFTLIGNGVNFTSRLEHACAPFKVMLGFASYDLLAKFPRQMKNFSTKHIRIKHHKKPLVCYEYDPFIDHEKDVQNVLRYFTAFHRQYSDEARWYLEEQDAIPVQTSYGDGFIINFSNGGLAICLSRQLSSNSMLELELKIDEFPQTLENRTRLVVCWSKPHDKHGIVHGCSFSSEEVKNSELFINNLRMLLNRSGKKAKLMERKHEFEESSLAEKAS